MLSNGLIIFIDWLSILILDINLELLTWKQNIYPELFPQNKNFESILNLEQKTIDLLVILTVYFLFRLVIYISFW